MKTKYLSSFFTANALALGMISLGQVSVLASETISQVTSESIFSCQLYKGTPTTIAQTSNGDAQPVLHWNFDSVTTSADPQQLCDSVSQKLNNYLAEGNDLSSISFKAYVTFQDEEPMNLPAICVANQEEPCKLMLFTLEPTANADLVANQALTSILDRDLQTNPIESRTRGIQSISYEVNLWQLLGFE